MSQHPSSRRNRAVAPWRIVACGAVAGALFLAQGCTSVSIEDAAPAGALGSTYATVEPEPETAPRAVPNAASLDAVAEADTTLGQLDVDPYVDIAVRSENLVRPTGASEIIVSETAETGTGAPVTVDGMGPSAPRESGQFPNLNLPPRSATRQFTPGQRNAKTRELASARSQLKSAVAEIPADKKEAERLRKLGQSHGKDALKQIEKR